MSPEDLDLEKMIIGETYLEAIQRVLDNMYFYSTFALDSNEAEAYVNRIMFLSSQYEAMTGERYEFKTQSRCIYD